MLYETDRKIQSIDKFRYIHSISLNMGEIKLGAILQFVRERVSLD